MNRSKVKAQSQKSRTRKTRVARASSEAIMRLESRQYMTTIIGYNVAGQTPAEAGPVPTAIVDSSVTGATGLSRGPGVLTSATFSATASFAGNGFNNSTGTAAQAAGQYFAFSFTIGAGKSESLTEFDDNYRRSGTGPSQEDLFYTLSGAESKTGDAGTIPLSSTSSTGATATLSLSSVSDLQNIPAGTTVQFQLAQSAASSTSGTYYVYHFSTSTAADIDVLGTVSSAANQTVSLNTSSVSIDETAGSVSLTVTRTPTASGDISGTLTVPYSTANGTAVSGTNYTGTTAGSLTFGPNVTTQTITVPVTAVEPQGGNKTFTVSLGTPSLTGDAGVSAADGSPSSATVTIVDDFVQTVGFNSSASTISVPESAGNAVLTVNRTASISGDTSGTITLPYSTANGTAASGTNYTGTTTGSISFGPGVLTQTISVPVIPVSPQGGNKTFTVTLGTPTITGDPGAEVADAATASSTVTIVDTAATYSVAYSTYSVNETEGTAEVSVTRTGYVANPATVTYNTSNGSAINGTNYSGVTGATLSFAVNQSTGVISVPITDVTNQGGNKTFTVTLTGVTPTTGDFGSLGTSTATTVTIVDAATVTNTLTGTAAVVSDIEASGPYNAGFGAVNGDSSGAGSFGFASYEVLDFNNASSPSVYPAGTSTLNSISNLSVEFYNTVAASAGGTYAAHPGDLDVYYETDTTTATSTLAFNTSAPTGVAAAQFTTAPVLLGTVSFSGATTGYDTYTPTAAPPSGLLSALNSRSAFRLIVAPATQGVGAVSADFAATAGGPGGGSALPIVSISGSLSVQPESFNISSTATSVSLGTSSVPITFDRSATSGNLSDAATATYTLVNGTAHSGTDYTGTGGTVYFAPNASAVTVNIALLNNTSAFGDRTFTVNVTGATTGPASVGEVGTPSSETVTITDARTTDITETASNIAVIQTVGPATATTYFTVEASNAANGTYASFAVADFNPATITNGQTVGTVNSATLELVNTVASFAAAGPLDVYIVDDTSTSLNSGGLAFNTSAAPEGLDGQLGNHFLLGTINYSPSPTIPAGQYTAFSLTNPAGLAELKTALNSGSDIRIVVTAEDTTVSARFVGFDLAAVQYPTLMLNYTPYVAGSLPSYLDPASQATYNSANDTVTVTGPTTFIADPGSSAPNVIASGASAAISFNTTSGSQLHLLSLNLSSGAAATENNPSARPIVLEIASNGLTIDPASTLNIGTGDVDVSGGSLAAITALAARGFNFAGGANWKGTGITSSAAASDSRHLTAVGVISDPTTGTFDGDTSAVAGDILVKYTYFGDANLSGKVDGSDYSLIDAGYAADKAHAGSATGWSNGDFNYDGTVDGSDYTLIDNAFNNQGTPITFSPSVVVAATTAEVAAVVTPVTVKSSALAAPKASGKLTRPVISAARVPTPFSTGPSIVPATYNGTVPVLEKKVKPDTGGSLFDSLTA
jgi:hypothetical protein